jgi:hypothetical protein
MRLYRKKNPISGDIDESEKSQNDCIKKLCAGWRARRGVANARTGFQDVVSKQAPLDQYLIADANAEMVLARSAAPDSISRDAEVMVLGRREIDLAGSPISHWKALFRSPW